MDEGEVGRLASWTDTLKPLNPFQAHPRDNRRKPSSQVLDAAGIRAAQSYPRFLDGVVRLAE